MCCMLILLKSYDSHSIGPHTHGFVVEFDNEGDQ
jgi:hypothetical protein